MQKEGSLHSVDFSFIIPVYNTSAYLQDCVESVLNQDFDKTRYEIILIDDGSTDDSPSICDRLAAGNSCVKAFHQCNQGLSIARNIGIEKAIGKYIIFLDSDDRILPNCCSTLYEIVKNQDIDVIVTNLSVRKSDHEEKLCHDSGLNNRIVSGREYLCHELKHNSLHMAAAFQVYRRLFLNMQNLRFHPYILHEDEEFSPRALLCAESVYVSDLCYYQYYIRENSITNQRDLYKNAKDLFATLMKLEAVYDKEAEPLRSYLKESLLEKYLYMYAKANAYEKRFDDIRNKAFVKGKAKSLRNRLKVLLFCFNDKLYCRINQQRGR